MSNTRVEFCTKKRKVTVELKNKRNCKKNNKVLLFWNVQEVITTSGGSASQEVSKNLRHFFRRVFYSLSLSLLQQFFYSFLMPSHINQRHSRPRFTVYIELNGLWIMWGKIILPSWWQLVLTPYGYWIYS